LSSYLGPDYALETHDLGPLGLILEYFSLIIFIFCFLSSFIYRFYSSVRMPAFSSSITFHGFIQELLDFDHDSFLIFAYDEGLDSC